MSTIVRRVPETNREPVGFWQPFRLMQDVMRWDPFRELDATGDAAFSPSFDVKETKDGFVFKADLPGIKESDLDIQLTGQRLTVSGKREAEKRDENERYFTWERSYGSFSRVFTLPDGVDGEHVAANMSDGVLTLTVPKKPEVKPRKIEVKK